MSAQALAADARAKSIAALYQDKVALNGQTIVVEGKVVKVNHDIMGKNWIHIKDGTGEAPANDLVVTTKQNAEVGDQVTVTGKVTINRDFGSGYAYALLIEDAAIAVKK
jgi:predicted acyltransferase (DUF342 family)